MANSAQGRRKLFAAAFSSDFEEMQRLVGAENVNVNVQDAFGFTALAVAFKKGRYIASNKLLQLGANPHLRTSKGALTPLHLACEAGLIGPGHLKSLLQEFPAIDVNAVDSEGKTPLMLALTGGHKQLAKVLIKLPRTDVTICDNRGRSALHYACDHDVWLDVVNLMIPRGAKPSSKSNINATCVHVATENGAIKLLRRLLRTNDGKACVNQQDALGATALQLAVSEGNLTAVKVLVELGGADIEVAAPYTLLRPLHYAAKDGNLAITRYLVSKGADVNAVAGYNETPLAFAIKGNHTDVALFLTSNGTNVGENPTYGDPLLIQAAVKNLATLVDAMCAAGANCNIRNSKNWIALDPIILFASDYIEDYEETILTLLDYSHRTTNFRQRPPPFYPDAHTKCSFFFPSRDYGLAAVLASFLSALRHSSPTVPIPVHRGAIRWAMQSPSVWWAPQTCSSEQREMRTSALRDVAWDRRRHLMVPLHRKETKDRKEAKLKAKKEQKPSKGQARIKAAIRRATIKPEALGSRPAVGSKRKRKEMEGSSSSSHKDGDEDREAGKEADVSRAPAEKRAKR
jgi:ankyrin repeat protein